MVVEIIGHTKCLLVGKRVGIVQPPAGQRFKVMDDWAGRKAAELLYLEKRLLFLEQLELV